MVSERLQRRIDRLLDQAEEAADGQNWSDVRRLSNEVLGLDPDNDDAPGLLRAADRVTAADDIPPPVAGGVASYERQQRITFTVVESVNDRGLGLTLYQLVEFS